MNSKKYILVTGGAGYIGSHTCKALAQAGYIPVVYDNLVYGHEWAVKWGPFEKGDITERMRLDEVIAKYNPIAVMHFAAYAYVGESVENPGKYYRNNVYGSLVLLEAMRDHGVQKIIFSSTCATYGVPKEIPIAENHAQKPINPYGTSKLMIEQILKDFDTAHHIQSVSLRYFNAAGADVEGEIGEVHDPETHLIPLVLDVASGKRSHVTIFGDDYETKDGTCIRDYIHVTDLADAHVRALQYLENINQSTVFNLGNGNGFSVKEVVATVEKVTGAEVPLEIGAKRAGDPACLIGDARKIQTELQWKPKFSNLETIIQTAWNWHQNNHKKN
ncbi:MAG: UDP-glucose 4-epimerase [Parcubacteria group bacterium GW2011_GWD2_42_14]|nr:MAG: UDP-glucose 4-epimerase [Parcubacteria group bacterium GW2011_GWD2_42_14]